MDLKITICNNFYKLRGALQQNNILFFQKEISEGLSSFQKLTISIDNLDSIDKHGVNALRDLHYLALQEEKELNIVGLGCKELYDHFNSTVEAA